MSRYLRPIIGIGIVCLVIVLISAEPAWAVNLYNPLDPDETGNVDVNIVIGRLIKAALGVSGVLALAMFVWGGLQWMLSAGEPAKVTKGKDTLTWAVIGLVVIFTAYTLVDALIKVVLQGAI